MNQPSRPSDFSGRSVILSGFHAENRSLRLEGIGFDRIIDADGNALSPAPLQETSLPAAAMPQLVLLELKVP